MALIDALIAACTEQGLPAAAGTRPANVGTSPFAVLWADAPVRAPERMNMALGDTTTVIAHCMGLTEESARIGEAKLAAAVYSLYGTKVDGRTVRYPEQLGSLPLVRDDNVSPPLYDLAAEWRLRTTPTT